MRGIFHSQVRENCRLKLEYVGVCGSDLHFYSEAPGQLGTGWSLVLGHEPGGVVSAIGEGVTGFEVGDRVALEPGVPCGHCEDCLKGHYNLCRSVRFMAIPGEKDGVFSEYCTHAASMTFKLPDNVSTMEGGLMDRWPWVCTLVSCPMQSWERRQWCWELGVSALLPLCP